MTWSIWKNNLPIDPFEAHIHPQATEVLIVPQPGALASEINTAADSLSLWPSSGIFNKYKTIISNGAAQFTEAAEQPLIALAQNEETWVLIVKPVHQNHGDFISASENLWPELKWESNGQELFNCKSNDWIGTLTRGLLIISNQAEWIEFDQAPIIENTLFAEVFRQRGQSASASWISQDQLTKDWSCVDLSIKNTGLLVNGYLPANSQRLLSPTGKMEIPAIPSKYKSIIALPLSDSESLWNNNERHFNSADSLAFFNNLISEIEEKMNCNLKEVMSSWPSDLAMQLSDEEKSIFIVSHRSALNTSSQLKSLADTTESISHLDQIIYKLKTPIQSSILLNHSFAGFIKNFTVSEGNVIFSEDSESIIQYLDDIALGRTQPLFEDSRKSDYLNRRSSILAINGSMPSLIPSKFHQLQGVEQNNLESTINLIQEEDGRVLLNMIIGNQSEHSVAKSSEIWSISLDGTFTRKPELVVNHYSSEKEIIIQDTENNLYLISAAGKILWRKALNEEIIGEIKQIDLFKNGKLQLIFATSKSIHLLDRNGKYVDAFPIKLPAPASSALSIFDYDKDRNYRLTIACEDGLIYNYTTEGKKTKGWKYKKSDQAIAWLDHFKLGSKDYIIAIGKQGEIQLLQRNGTTRQEVKVKAEDWMQGSVYLHLQATINESGLLFADNSGQVNSLTFGGKKQKLFSPSPSAHSLILEDVDNDGSPEALALDSKSLSVYRLDGTVSWKKEFEESPGVPGIYRFGRRDNRIGIQAGDEIWLLDEKGEACAGFPLTGNTPLTIGDLKRNGELQMIYGKAGRYLIDQRVQ